MRRIKVRFNLGKGKNYQKWKIQSNTTGVEYHYPDDVQIIMHNCILKNNRKVADKIHSGENKDVCAWILCESISIIPKDIKWLPYLKIDKSINFKLKYNPRVVPYWVIEESNADNTTFNNIASSSNELFIIPNENIVDTKYALDKAVYPTGAYIRKSIEKVKKTNYGK